MRPPNNISNDAENQVVVKSEINHAKKNQKLLLIAQNTCWFCNFHLVSMLRMNVMLVLLMSAKCSSTVLVEGQYFQEVALNLPSIYVSI